MRKALGAFPDPNNVNAAAKDRVLEIDCEPGSPAGVCQQPRQP